MKGLRRALLKVVIVLAPSYSAAYLTGEMVWVVPTLVASGFLAASIGVSDRVITRVDEDGDGEDEEDDSGGVEE